MMKKISNVLSYVGKAFRENGWVMCPSGMIPSKMANV